MPTTPKTKHYDTDHVGMFAIRLPVIGGGYFCYPATKHHPKTVCVYSKNDERLPNDLALSRGDLVPIEGDVYSEIFLSGKYSNQQPSPRALVEEYKLMLREAARAEDNRQLTLAL